MHHTVFFTCCSLVTDVNIDIAHCAESMVGKSGRTKAWPSLPVTINDFLRCMQSFFFPGGSAMVAYYKSLSEISNIKTPRKRNVKPFVTQPRHLDLFTILNRWRTLYEHGMV